MSGSVGSNGSQGGGGRRILNLKLRKFDMSRIKHDKVVVMIGKRETGKSYLVKDLLWYNKDIPVGTVISGTEGANQFYAKIVPPLFIHEEYTPLIIGNVLKRQKLIGQKILKDIQTRGSSLVDPRTFLILDDCLYDQSWVRDKNIRYLFMNGRHVHCLFIITMQYALGVPPNLRTNIDYTFILRENIQANRRRLYEQYAGMFPDFESFCQVMDQCTENFECMVIDNNAKSNKLEDQVFWYKAPPHQDYRIGAQEFWDHSANNMRDGEGGDEEDYDSRNGAHSRRAKAPLIQVRKY